MQALAINEQTGEFLRQLPEGVSIGLLIGTPYMRDHKQETDIRNFNFMIAETGQEIELETMIPIERDNYSGTLCVLVVATREADRRVTPIGIWNSENRLFVSEQKPAALQIFFGMSWRQIAQNPFVNMFNMLFAGHEKETRLGFTIFICLSLFSVLLMVILRATAPNGDVFPLLYVLTSLLGSLLFFFSHAYGEKEIQDQVYRLVRDGAKSGLFQNLTQPVNKMDDIEGVL